MKKREIVKTSYDDIMKSIRGESAHTNPIEASDKVMLSLIKSENHDPEYDKRNALYTDLMSYYLDSFVKKDESKKNYKKAFFIIVMIMFCFIIIFSIFFVYISIGSEEASTESIVMIIGSFGSIASALFIIPKVIAEHLFPKDEESHMIDMVKNMQLNDTGIRNLMGYKKPADEDNEK